MNSSDNSRLPALAWQILLGLSLLKYAIHMATAGEYGYFWDELYYAACGEHLSWGYVDNAPLIAAIAKFSRWTLSDSLYALRFFPALTGALLIFLTGATTRELGGEKWAQLLAALAVLVAPGLLGVHVLLTMNAFEPLFWTAAAFLLIRILRRSTDNDEYSTANKLNWILFGVVTGIGLLNKHSMGFFAVCLFAGILCSPQRKVLKSPWPWSAAFIAAMFIAPNLWWLAERNWPIIELQSNGKINQIFPLNPAIFIGGQFVFMNILCAPIWIAGLHFCFTQREQRYAALGWSYFFLMALFLVTGAKIYYFTPIYPMLFAAGGVAVERWTAARRDVNKPDLRVLTISAVAISGFIMAPFSLPMLPLDVREKLVATLGLQGKGILRHRLGVVSFTFPGMFGWKNLAQQTAQFYHRLSQQDQKRCAIWTRSYGQAAAIDYFGDELGLPRAISGNQNYYIWGPREYSGDVMLVVGFTKETLKPYFSSVEKQTTVSCEFCWQWEREVPIFLCRGLKQPLQDFWPQVKCYNCDAPPFVQKVAPHIRYIQP